MVFLEDFKHLVLAYECAKLRRVAHRGYAQKQSVVVFFKSEERELCRIGEHRTVIVVDEAVYVII